MNIQGLQKLTLLDYPGLMACTLFTGGCNFRCPFCHNAGLIAPKPEAVMSEDDVLAFLRKRSGLLDGICLTGGEPLLQPDLGDFLQKVRSLGYKIKLDTNGSQPQALKKLVAENLVDYVAMDIKNAPDKYDKTIGLVSYDWYTIKESAAFLLSGAVDYEFRTTVVQELHEADDFVQIGQWLRGAKRYYLQSFVDSEQVLSKGLHSPTLAQMKLFQTVVSPFIPQTMLRGVDDI